MGKRFCRAVKGVAILMSVCGMAAFTQDQTEQKKMKGTHRCYGVYERYIKRPLDASLAAGGLVFLSPVLAAAALAVRVKLGSPVLFVQERPGKGGKIFRLYKFRTMTDKRGQDGKLCPDGERLTEFGGWLRGTSLDELPELWNILLGDMSLVGPRPLLVEYLGRYNKRQARRHEVRPGLTGLAQVHGRNAVSWEERLEWDVRYVERITFMSDWQIVRDTVRIVLKREGITPAASATMEVFEGNAGEDGAI